MPSSPYFGVLLPHFGSHANQKRIVKDSVTIESYGFDSVWVRDHVVFTPHSFEDQNRTHVDPLVALSAIAGVTERVRLGMATLIPHRHPIHAALALGSLDLIAGSGRLIVGVGTGFGGHEFASVGLADVDRLTLLQEQVQIMRDLWTGESITHTGKYYQFQDVQIRPIPSAPPPFWYGGNSYAAARRAVEFCEGWVPARMPRFALRRRLKRMDEVISDLQRPVRPTVAVLPFVVPGRTVEEATAKLDLREFFAMCDRSFGKPPRKDAYETLADLDGGAIAGPPDVITQEVSAYLEAGVDHFVFDLRPAFAEWEKALAVIGEEVLPALRAMTESEGQ